MKYPITILLFILIVRNSAGQIVIGQLKDNITNEPIEYADITIEADSFIGAFTNTDEKGCFEIVIAPNHNLVFSYMGYGSHKILNINSMADTINLGVVKINYTGSLSHSMVVKKKRFSKKTKMKCVAFDDRKEVKPKFLIVRCDDDDETKKYVWIKRAEQSFEVEYKDILRCSSISN